MGYRGKLAEPQQARLLRSSGRPWPRSTGCWPRAGPSSAGCRSGSSSWPGVALYAVPDPTIRHAKQVRGCVSIDYSCSPTHRSIMGLVAGLLGDDVTPG